MSTIVHEVEEILDALGDVSGGVGRPTLIGIDGFGGSGKSTLANAVGLRLGSAHVVALDHFLVKERIDDASWERVFDRDRLRRQVLTPARAGEVIAYQRLEWAANRLDQPRFVPPVEYLIVEGTTALHPELREYYDLTIWVDCQLDIARERGRARDAGNENEQRWDQWAQNDLHYVEQHHPDAVADLTFDVR